MPVAPTPARASPAQSMLSRTRRRGMVSARATAIQAKAPKGRKNQKMERQPSQSVSQPPSSGPRIAAMPNMAPMGARYFPRTRGGMRSPAMAWEQIMRPAPPRPWRKRKTVKPSMPAAVPHSAEPPTNRAIASR